MDTIPITTITDGADDDAMNLVREAAESLFHQWPPLEEAEPDVWQRAMFEHMLTLARRIMRAAETIELPSIETQPECECGEGQSLRAVQPGVTMIHPATLETNEDSERYVAANGDTDERYEDESFSLIYIECEHCGRAWKSRDGINWD